MEMSFEDYPRGLRHCVILADDQVVFETMDEDDAFFTLTLFEDRVPGVEHTLVIGQPFRAERTFQ